MENEADKDTKKALKATTAKGTDTAKSGKKKKVYECFIWCYSTLYPFD